MLIAGLAVGSWLGCMAPEGTCRAGETCAFVIDGEAARIDCLAAGRCEVTCVNGADCGPINCVAAGTCEVDCVGSTCGPIFCDGADRCDVTCREGATCDVVCRDTAECDDVRCQSGSTCTLDCPVDDASCRLGSCTQLQQACPDGRRLCGDGLSC